MRGKFLKGITTGIMIGAAASMMMMPELDRNTRKKIRNSKKMFSNMAENMYDNVRSWM